MNEITLACIGRWIITKVSPRTLAQADKKGLVRIDVAFRNGTPIHAYDVMIGGLSIARIYMDSDWRYVSAVRDHRWSKAGMQEVPVS